MAAPLFTDAQRQAIVSKALDGWLDKASANSSPLPSAKYVAPEAQPARLYSPRVRERNLAALDRYVTYQRAAAVRIGGAEGEARIRRAVAHVQAMVPALMRRGWNKDLAGLTAIDLSNAIAVLDRPLSAASEAEAA